MATPYTNICSYLAFDGDTISWMQFEFPALVWQHSGQGGWYFVTVPPELGSDIAELTASSRRGFGSLHVTAQIAEVSWDTSIFPDTASRSYLLPIKRAVRIATGIADGDSVEVTLTVHIAT